jgi:hypothetical protein
MARGRLINTCLWTSKKVAAFSLRHRLLWVGLITTADDQGRGRAEPGIIVGKVFPFEEISHEEIQQALDDFAGAGMIQLYTVEGGKDLYQIMKWWEDKYQGGMRWAWPSEYAPPEGWADRHKYRKGNAVVKENWEADDNGDNEDDNGATADSPRGHGGASAGPAPNGNTNGNDDTNGKDSEGADAPPTSFADWHKLVETQKNRQAVLRRMFVALYPGREPPEYSYLGKVARKVGGAGRLAEWLWLCSPKPPSGDVLAYIQAAAKRDKARGQAQSEPAGYDAIRTYAARHGMEAEAQ